jgi:hypothetical protein
MSNAAATLVTVTCIRCGGSGFLSHQRHVDGGRCFRCSGAGREQVTARTAKARATRKANATQRAAEARVRAAEVAIDHGTLLSRLRQSEPVMSIVRERIATVAEQGIDVHDDTALVLDATRFILGREHRIFPKVDAEIAAHLDLLSEAS